MNVASWLAQAAGEQVERIARHDQRYPAARASQPAIVMRFEIAAEGVPQRAVLVALQQQGHSAVEKRQHRSQRQFARSGLGPQPGVDACPQCRQGAAEGRQPVVFPARPHRLPVGMIAVLLAPPSVAAGGLQMAPRLRRDPDRMIRRRHGDGLDPPTLGRVCEVPLRRRSDRSIAVVFRLVLAAGAGHVLQLRHAHGLVHAFCGLIEVADLGLATLGR